MDEIDLKLLRLLQRTPAPPSRPLQVRFAFPLPAVSARIERLEKQGVIRAYTLDLDPLQLGHHILAYIHLDMQPTQKEEFLSVHCCVLECARVQLRDRQLLHADQRCRSPRRRSWTALSDVCKIRQDRNTDRVFLAGAAESHCGMRKACVCRLFFSPQDGGNFDLSAC